MGGSQLNTHRHARVQPDPGGDHGVVRQGGRGAGSALNQLRTNESALNTLWERCEFHIDKASHLLFEDTTKQTPDETLNNSAAVAGYVNANAADVKLDKHVVPDHFPGAGNSFMTATSRASPGQFNTHFRAPGVPITTHAFTSR